MSNISTSGFSTGSMAVNKEVQSVIGSLPIQKLSE